MGDEATVALVMELDEGARAREANIAVISGLDGSSVGDVLATLLITVIVSVSDTPLQDATACALSSPF